MTSAKNTDQSIISNVTRFTELGLIPQQLARLTELEYTQPTAIQAQAIPAVLSGRDLIAGANTGMRVCP